MEDKKYFITGVKYKKSVNFLYPLLGFSQNSVPCGKDTFLYWSETDDSIDDYKLIVLFKTEYDEVFQKFEQEYIITRENLESVHIVEGGRIYIFDLIQYHSDIRAFMEGSYSRFKAQTKRIIMGYFGNPDDQTIMPGRPIHMALYPDLYRKLVAEELMDEDVEHMEELANKYEIKEEICYLKEI